MSGQVVPPPLPLLRDAVQPRRSPARGVDGEPVQVSHHINDLPRAIEPTQRLDICWQLQDFFEEVCAYPYADEIVQQVFRSGVSAPQQPVEDSGRDDELQFFSDFESGNLKAAFRVKNRDSNDRWVWVCVDLTSLTGAQQVGGVNASPLARESLR